MISQFLNSFGLFLNLLFCFISLGMNIVSLRQAASDKQHMIFIFCINTCAFLTIHFLISWYFTPFFSQSFLTVLRICLHMLMALYIFIFPVLFHRLNDIRNHRWIEMLSIGLCILVIGINFFKENAAAYLLLSASILYFIIRGILLKIQKKDPGFKSINQTIVFVILTASIPLLTADIFKDNRVPLTFPLGYTNMLFFPFILSAVAFILAWPDKIFNLQTETLLSNQNTPESLVQSYGKTLSIREREIMLYLFQGKRNKEIAAVLNISESTVKKHVQSIFKKTRFNSRRDLLNHSYT